MTRRRARIRPTLLLVLATGLAGALTGCGGDDPAESDLDTIKISGSPHLFVAPLLIADAEGYFAEQGLRIEILVIPGSTSEAIPALASGSLDVVTGRTNIGLFNAMANDAPIRIVASQGLLLPDTCPTDALVIRGTLATEGALPPVDSLRGRRVSVNRMTLDGYYIDALLARAGLDLDDIEAITIPNASIYDALSRGAIDFAAVPEPHVTHLLEAGHVIYAAANDVVPGLQTRSILFGPNLMKDRPDLGRRFLVAYLMGLRRYDEGKTDRNLDILARATSVERDLLERACWPTVPIDGSVDLEGLADFQEWAMRRGLLARAARSDQMWEPRFLEEAEAALADGSP